MNLSKYKTLGVINRTPNSFSDHGASLNPDHFDSQLKSFLDDPTVIVDVGFESTAPMNQAISSSEEYARFLSFLLASKDYSFTDRFISFDTYKVQNFLLMADEFQKLHPEAHLIFNDVSGVLDTELKEALLEFKGKKFYYIYTFTHIPDRSQVLNHMKFLSTESDIIEATANAFNRAYKWFKSFGMESQLILDPGFGFSKTYEQNWQLINCFNDLEVKTNLSLPVLIGLSKKSFLKKALEHHPAMELEDLHKKCICDLQKASKMDLLFRVHDPKIMNT
jgi:dihydropteroate synthase